MLDLIICANFGVEKLKGLGYTRGQILEFPIEMAGHLYNRAGATAQPVIRLRYDSAHMDDVCRQNVCIQFQNCGQIAADRHGYY